MEVLSAGPPGKHLFKKAHFVNKTGSPGPAYALLTGPPTTRARPGRTSPHLHEPGHPEGQVQAG